MTDPRFFELLDHVGVEADGSLGPLVQTHVDKAVPTLVDGVFQMVVERITLTPVGKSQADCRVAVTTDATVAEHLLSTGLWREVDPSTPVQKRLRTKLAQEA